MTATVDTAEDGRPRLRRRPCPRVPLLVRPGSSSSRWPIAGAAGLLRLGLRRSPLPGLLLPARQHQHRPPAPEGRRRHQGAGRPALHLAPQLRQRRAQPGGPPDLRAGARQSNKVFFTNAGAEAIEHAIRMARLHTVGPSCSSAYRSYHGATTTAINLTGDPRRFPTTTAAPASPTSSGRSCTARPSTPTTERRGVGPGPRAPRERRPVRGPRHHRRHRPRDDPRHRRHHDAAPRATWPASGSCATATASSTSPTRSWRLRPHGKWFAFEHFGVRPDLVTFAKGVNSGYVPLGGVIISDAIAATFADRALPGRAHLLGPPAGLRGGGGDDRGHEGGGHRRERRPHRRGGAPAGPDRAPGDTASIGECGGWASSSPSTSYGTARRGSPSPPTAAPARRWTTSCGLQGQRAPAVHELQPPARRSALHGQRGRGPRGPGDARRGAEGGRRPHGGRLRGAPEGNLPISRRGA